MHDVLRVRVLQRRGELLQDLQRLLRLEPFGDAPAQVATGEQAHGVEVDAFAFPDGVDLDDARMLEGGGGPHLALEAGEHVAGARELR